MIRRRTLIALTALVPVLLVACGDDDDASTGTTASSDTAAAGTTGTTGGTGGTVAGTTAGSTPTSGAAGTDVSPVVAGEPFPEDRCAANEAAGTITYLSGFDFAATASIIDVVVADAAGYYEDLCLDVELQPSFSTANYPIVAAGDAQIGSGGSFSEVVDFATANDTELVAIDVEGRTAIDSLILHPGVATELEDLAGSTIGVKGKIPPSVAAMLAGAGLVEGTDYQTVPMDGFDPVAQFALDGIVGFPGYKSNEPGTLERAGIDFDLFDPTEYDVPGSFGVLFTTAAFAEEHPTAVEDFMRATMKGLADAIADPQAATQTAVDLVEANGNPSFLSLEGESFRWATDSASLTAETPPGTGIGIPDPELLQAELDAYAAVGLFGGTAPDAAPFILAAPIAGVYDGDTVIWPA
jgi:NitT/TauT family transport system substrate-binding protein